jgi:methylmalonyl-CoA mutase
MLYEHKKHDGSLPIVGVNTFLNPGPAEEHTIELTRSTDDEKKSQIERLRDFQKRNSDKSELAIEKLRGAAINNENVFAELVDAVRYCSLGQITDTFFEVGGNIDGVCNT